MTNEAPSLLPEEKQSGQALQFQTLGELSELSIDERSKWIANYDRTVLENACFAKPLHPSATESRFRSRLAWAIAHNINGGTENGLRPLRGFKDGSYREKWPDHTRWDDVWHDLTTPRRSKAGNGILAMIGLKAEKVSDDSDPLLHDLVKSIMCEQRDDWQPSECRPLDIGVAQVAFETLYLRHTGHVEAVVGSKMGKKTAVGGQFVQQAWSKAFEAYWCSTAQTRFLGLSKITTMLFTIAMRLWFDELRHRKKADRIGAEPVRDRRPSSRPESAINITELQEREEQCVSKLPARQQIVYRMVRGEGMSQIEVARRLGISQSAVSQLFTKAGSSVAECVRTSGWDNA